MLYRKKFIQTRLSFNGKEILMEYDISILDAQKKSILLFRKNPGKASLSFTYLVFNHQLGMHSNE